MSAEAGSDKLAPEVEELVRRARAAWPALALADVLIAGALAERFPDGGAGRAAAPVEDIALAAACAAGIPGAADAFEQAHGADLQAVIARVIAAPELREEAAQRTRAHLLVASPGERPKIAGYRGSAGLRAFVRVVAARIAIDVLRGERGDRRAASDDAAAGVPDPAADLELGLLQRRYGGAVRDAIAEGLAALDARERTLLRYQLVDGLSIDRLAVLYDVHRSTVARQLERARRELIRHVKKALVRGVGVSGDELASIVRMVRSQLDLSVRRMLASAPG